MWEISIVTYPRGIFVKMKNKPICVISIENISDGFLISSYNHISNERDFAEARKLIKSE